jgi:hypothetical protein
MRLLGHDPSNFVRIPWHLAYSAVQDESYTGSNLRIHFVPHIKHQSKLQQQIIYVVLGYNRSLC